MPYPEHRRERQMADGMDRKRWHVLIRYKANVYPAAFVNIEELAELHGIIERGPDWNLISSIKVTLNVAKAEAA
jgi:hypothetical protein